MSSLGYIQVRPGWLFSKQLDLAIFFYPMILAIGFWFIVHAHGMGQSAFLTFAILQGFGLGPFHLGVTWFYLFDPELREHFVGKRSALIKVLALFALILASSVVGMMLVPMFVYFIYLLWTIQHMVQQNVGILLLYHNHDGKEAVVSRDLEIATMHRAAWLWTLIFFSRLATHGSFLFFASWLAVAFALIDLCWLLSKYFVQLNKQLRSSQTLNLPALGFWVLSLLFLFPLALIGDYNQAILLPLIMHWIQYIGLNLVLTGRKYELNAAGFKTLSPGSALVLCGSIIVLVFALSELGATSVDSCHSAFRNAFIGLILGFGMLHYVQDAFLWRFKNPVIRKSLLPYLRNGA